MYVTHAALRNDDILHEIFKHLKPPLIYSKLHCYPCEQDPDYQRTLCAAARTCKAFSQPALKFLWTHVFTLDALFCLLSSSIKIVSDVVIPDEDDLPREAPRHQETVWILEGPITDNERERFLWYTQYIRTMYLRTSRRVDPWVFFRLSHENLGMPLAPQLNTIICEYDWPYMDMAVSLLSGPSLRVLDLTFGGPDSTIDDDWKLPLNRHNYAPRPLLKNICASAPNLEKLSVGMCAHPSLLHPIGDMQQLRALDLSTIWTPIDMDLVRRLSCLVRLEELAFPHSFDTRDAAPCEGFKNVKRLSLRGSIRTIPALLATLPDLRLEELRLMDAVIGEPAPVEELVTSLPLGTRSSLSSVRIENLTTLGSLAAPVPTLIAPFFTLPNIRSFFLFAEDPLNFTDKELHVICGVWTKLEALTLSCNISFRPVTVAPTMEGIIELANLFPMLHRVTFSSVVLQPSLGIVDSHLVRELPLDVQIPDRNLRDVHQVACILWHMFLGLHVPNLDKFSFKKWSAVLDEITRLQDDWEKHHDSEARWST
ncbi:uncharacterized protein B0H18DRAFT_1175366 [Fomitopsis serialis]|uniref:uncharacterized protein n=1 Tax=Fomitopsis serialis TaxID=139415 RepID=UPI002007C347|nr:uncharacterized protein B0H18DRAFT_1175366 [Neoantrodia serialis]KAH9924563.1 hypothetical protein B0H18DRAFT_1175366 [Neoantrodia serialis]